ncbi:hypothetical protein N9112_02925 [bacterium]|nr:hypothetical protein [bacterium]
MTAIRNNEKLKGFVRNTLGCGCPEEVFEKIDVSMYLAVGHEKEVTRIVVGDTLLIYIIAPETYGDLIDGIESLGLAGKKDRDINNYNRFRLVVSGLEGDVRQREASEHFSEFFKMDAKMHIHFVNQELVEGLS